MTREQLDAIRARVEAATPGPWEAGTAFCCPDMGWVDGPKRTVCPVYEGTKRTHTLDANDAEFIAHARVDVSALLAEVERLRDTINAVGEVISQNGEDCDCDCTAYGSPHGPDCEPCLACRVSDALGEKP